MRINLDSLEKMGFHAEIQSRIVDIYPREHRDIAPELQELTELPKRDCILLMEDISDMQIIQAIKTAA